MNKFFETIWDILLTVFISFSIFILITNFIVAPFRVNGQSMMPNMESGQLILVNKFNYKVLKQNYERWDVVVVDVKQMVWSDKWFFVKRIVGQPWDTIKLKDWKIFITTNNVETQLDESEYFEASIYTPHWSSRNLEDWIKLWEWEYVLFWDNRWNSLDSRNCFQEIDGCSVKWATEIVKQEYILGKVMFQL